MLMGFWGAVLVAAVATVASAQMSAPSAEFHPAFIHKAEPVGSFLLPRGAPVRGITLRPPAAAESSVLTAHQAPAPGELRRRIKGRRLPVGFARAVPVADSVLRLADLPWQTVADGMQAAQVAVTSPDAAAVRLGLALKNAPPGLVARFQGGASGAPVYGPVPAVAITRETVFWSPVLEGETGTIEFALPVGIDPGRASVELPVLSHLAAAGGDLKAFGLNIGKAGPCEVDIACLGAPLRQQLLSATNAVARMAVTIEGSTYLCSGTLLNDSLNSFTPYFLTADHCLEDPYDPGAGRGVAAASASTINTYWFFQAAACGSLATPNYVLVAGGAKLLARSVDYDWALLQLNVMPPAGTTFAAWSADGPIGIGTAAGTIHHPGSDLKKFTQGNVRGFQAYDDGSTFIRMAWISGATEPGSSGGGLFVLNPAANHYELRGALSGGESSCTFPRGIDEFSRFDVAFPLIRDYLAPTAANPAKTAPVVEFYNAAKDDHFITASPSEISGLDSGTPAGWVRTGYRFLAYTDPGVAPAGSQPVCRLYAPPPYGDTRFYSASPQECAATLGQQGGHWISESAAAFYIGVPDPNAATCPAGARPVYRLVNTANPVRHRYTAEVDLRDSLLENGGWSEEGVGVPPNRVALCAPLNDQAAPSLPAAANYQGLWWNAPAESERGWGINLNHQGDTIFATWFTFGLDGKPLWLVVSATRVAPNVYSGNLFTGTGPSFKAFDPTRVVPVQVGSATFTFYGADSATFAYAVNGITQSKPLVREIFGPVPTCSWGGQSNLALATNFQGVWWNAPAGSETGWGINFTHQGDTIFATWFTFGLDGNPLWLVVSAVKTAPNVYAGVLYKAVSGPAFNAVPFDPAKVIGTPAGGVTLTFADGNNATFTYSVDGIAQTKSITRQVFAPPGTVCF